DRVVVEHQRCMAEGFRTTSKDKIHRAFANISISRIDRLHTRSTIDLHSERCHRLAHAKTQRGDACWVHFVGGNVDAAKNDLIEGIGCEWLTEQQRTPAFDSSIERRGGPCFATRLDDTRRGTARHLDRTPWRSAAG